MDEKQHRPCFRRHSAAICMGLIFALSTILGSAQALGSNEVAQSGKTQVQELVPVGRAVGVKLFAEGVLVVKLSEEEQTASPAKNSGLKTGDIILMMNDIKIESTEQVQSLLEEN